MTRRRCLLGLAGWTGLGALLGTGCHRSGDSTEGEWYSNWDLAGTCNAPTPRQLLHDAHGHMQHFCPRPAASPVWTWVFYGAPWCSASRWQAQRMPAFLALAAHRAAVYTVLTGVHDPFTIPTVDDARAWAASTGLAADRVLFDPVEDDVRTIPQHLLIAPDGSTGYRYVGGLSPEDMSTLLEDFLSGRRHPRVRRMR